MFPWICLFQTLFTHYLSSIAFEFALSYIIDCLCFLYTSLWLPESLFCVSNDFFPLGGRYLFIRVMFARGWCVEHWSIYNDNRWHGHVSLFEYALGEATIEEPTRIWGEKCTKSDIVINQGPTAPLPTGIPTYTVEVVNACVTGCDIYGIHFKCGWFSSAHLINPRVFKRLHYDDCLVNDGKPLVYGGTLSFQYANTYPYPLSVSSVVCKLKWHGPKQVGDAHMKHLKQQQQVL